MRIKCFRVENFRRLKNARVDLETDRTIFVGANNCGKTSATHLFQMFLRSDGHANPIAFGGNCDIYRCCPVKFRAGGHRVVAKRNVWSTDHGMRGERI